jgi:hypothetical protein
MLLFQRGHHCHHCSDKAGTLRALGPKAPLVPEVGVQGLVRLKLK